MCTGLFCHGAGCRQLHRPRYKRSRCLCPGEPCCLKSWPLLHNACAQQECSPTAACMEARYSAPISMMGWGFWSASRALEDLWRPFLPPKPLELTGQNPGSESSPRQHAVSEIPLPQGLGINHRQRHLCLARAHLCVGWRDSSLFHLSPSRTWRTTAPARLRPTGCLAKRRPCSPGTVPSTMRFPRLCSSTATTARATWGPQTAAARQPSMSTTSHMLWGTATSR